MSTTLTVNQLFVFSEKEQRYFYTEFSDDVTIVYGRNTSGKSTVLQSIIYAIGINDGNAYLEEILQYEVFFRLDCTLKRDGEAERLLFIREGETLFIKFSNDLMQRFNGISANNSFEHIRLKNYISDLFRFTLHLESKEEYKQAPLEAMFLPYYISQAVGWVYLRKSFGSLDFYRNFKEDYLDYYLGLEPFIERREKLELQKKLKSKNDKIDLIANFEKSTTDLQITKLIDENFVEKSKQYIEGFTEKQSSLLKAEKDFVLKSNELGFLTERLLVIRRVSQNHKKQKPELDRCPSCHQHLPGSISNLYSYFQDENNTEQEIKKHRVLIKAVQSDVNSLQKSILEKKAEISQEYSVITKYSEEEVSYENWLKNKANAILIDDLVDKLGELIIEVNEIETQLRKFKTDEELQNQRNYFNSAFYNLFQSNLKALGVKPLTEQRHTQLYYISSFPSQGVELHKTVMAYHFAFNKLIKNTTNVHRLPFILDAIFKEDIDAANKEIIPQFISNNRPKDTQLIFSVAQKKGDFEFVEDINLKYFNGNAKLVPIGNCEHERSFLSIYNDEHNPLLEETLSILAGEDIT